MTLIDIIQRYGPALQSQPGNPLTSEQYSAINALLGCRTEQYGTLELACRHCANHSEQYLSCGHRFCNRCQHHSTRQWLARQQQKQLPVPYFMVTFTLPLELRGLAKRHPKTVYNALFQSAISTLKDFGRNHRNLQASLGMTAVLHTHSRRLDYHPHVHVVIPGGGVHLARKEWRTLKGRYLFNSKALARVFRARLLAGLAAENLKLPATPKQWVCQCQKVGYGDTALKYLSRYLYKGVISDRNILSDDGTHVTFEYTDSQTNQPKTRTLLGEDFLKLILQHVLPKGFRRVRDYGFLHGNAKALLKTIQWILRVNTSPVVTPKRACFVCQHCQQAIEVVGVHKPATRWQPG